MEIYESRIRKDRRDKSCYWGSGLLKSWVYNEGWSGFDLTFVGDVVIRVDNVVRSEA